MSKKNKKSSNTQKTGNISSKNLKSNGKSHSIIGGLYTYKKHKKPKRLGKDCKLFNKDKSTCKLNNHLCKNADSCTHFVVDTEKLPVKNVIKSKTHETDIIGVTAIVLNDNRKCTNNNHTIVDVEAKVRIGDKNGKVIIYAIPAAYCKNCDTYFMFKKDFKEAKSHGIILCPVIDMTSKTLAKKNQSKLSSSESHIHQLGYNVRKGNGYTTEQRQLILANILENTNISKHEIESCILRPMSQHKTQPNYKEAVEAWKQDLEFIKNYNLGDLPEVIIDKIVIGKR